MVDIIIATIDCCSFVFIHLYLMPLGVLFQLLFQRYCCCRIGTGKKGVKVGYEKQNI
jgi:hypothetical protein